MHSLHLKQANLIEVNPPPEREAFYILSSSISLCCLPYGFPSSNGRLLKPPLPIHLEGSEHHRPLKVNISPDLVMTIRAPSGRWTQHDRNASPHAREMQYPPRVEHNSTYQPGWTGLLSTEFGVIAVKRNQDLSSRRRRYRLSGR